MNSYTNTSAEDKAFVETRELIGNSLIGDSKAVFAVTYSADGKHIASGCDDGTIRLMDAETGESLNKSAGPDPDFGFAWIGATPAPACFGLPAPGTEVWGDWGSNHAGVVQFAFADGSVRPLRAFGNDEADPRTAVFRALAGYRDGQAADAGALAN